MKIDPQELQEFRDFVNENEIRQNFFPILHHLTRLAPKDVKVDEFADKDGNTTAVQVEVEAGRGDPIFGRVGWDAFDKDQVSFELWWDEECYCLCHGVVEMQNMLTILVKQVQFKTIQEQKAFRRSPYVMEVPE